jgi:hypothetical protein
VLLLTLVRIAFQGCKKDDEKTTVLLFPPSKDDRLGREVQQEIFNNPQQYPLLDSVQYASAYAYLRGLKDSILNTGKID